MLLIDSVNINIQEHQERVNRALALLEHHSYIERNGELYEFLTNKEKDIETEIKNTRIEESDVNKMMKELFLTKRLVAVAYATRITNRIMTTPKNWMMASLAENTNSRLKYSHPTMRASKVWILSKVKQWDCRCLD